MSPEKDSGGNCKKVIFVNPEDWCSASDKRLNGNQAFCADQRTDVHYSTDFGKLYEKCSWPYPPSCPDFEASPEKTNGS